ncbi:hypothetical protein [Nitrosococcus watsonii]|uniref:Uncharacterized protein n=1 Tax=Nitrosococcus watsoni (strain C-113) TaxID=105559 RepID=D8KAB8_NITWC|nr:hypothetical protein [Nitrosococcus watsonii]ADJ27433.1 conserved hypothetical protein [Nitrosococcus watsonii C-113]
MNAPKVLIIIAIIFVLINLIGWLTKPDNYKSNPDYRGSLSPMQTYGQLNNEHSILAPTANRQMNA